MFPTTRKVYDKTWICKNYSSKSYIIPFVHISFRQCYCLSIVCKVLPPSTMINNVHCSLVCVNVRVYMHVYKRYCVWLAQNCTLCLLCGYFICCILYRLNHVIPYNQNASKHFYARTRSSKFRFVHVSL